MKTGESSSKNISDAVVGDLIAYRDRYWERTYTSKVVRVTKRRVVLENDTRVSRKSGLAIGDKSWNPTLYHIATQEDIDRERKGILVFALKTCQWNKLPLPVLEIVSEAIKPGTGWKDTNGQKDPGGTK